MYLPNLCQDLISSAIGLSHLSALKEPFHKPFGISVHPDYSAWGILCLANWAALKVVYVGATLLQAKATNSIPIDSFERCSEIKKWPKPVISGRARIPCGKMGWLLSRGAAVVQIALITTDLVSRTRAS